MGEVGLVDVGGKRVLTRGYYGGGYGGSGHWTRREVVDVLGTSFVVVVAPVSLPVKYELVVNNERKPKKNLPGGSRRMSRAPVVVVGYYRGGGGASDASG